MFKIILLTCLVAVSLALTKKEIEKIREELNGELTKLESKRGDDKVQGSDPKKDDFLKDLIKQAKNDDSNSKKLWKLMVQPKNELDETNKVFDKIFEEAMRQNAKKSEKARIEELLKKKPSAKKSAKNKDDTDEFLNLLSKQEGLEAEKRSTENEATDALFKMLIKEEEIEKRSTEKDADMKILDLLIKDDDLDQKRNIHSPEKCKKDWTDNCKTAARNGFCKRHLLKMKKYCYESCGYCRRSSPPACQSDPKGCCWDKKSFARYGCPACRDGPKIRNLCRNLKGACKNKYNPGDYMRKNCPVTCQICKPECEDEKYYHNICSEWEKVGLCSNQYVKSICRGSCNTCHLFKPVKIN